MIPAMNEPTKADFGARLHRLAVGLAFAVGGPLMGSAVVLAEDLVAAGHTGGYRRGKIGSSSTAPCSSSSSSWTTPRTQTGSQQSSNGCGLRSEALSPDPRQPSRLPSPCPEQRRNGAPDTYTE